MTKIGKIRIDFIAVIILLLAGLKLTSGIEQIVDIGLFDESGYLYGGVSFLQKGLFPAAWAPLYALWYFFLSIFESDRIALYYLNYKILTILPVILMYILMRSCKISVLIAVFAAWMFLISMANLYVWPRPSHFALVIILTFLLIVRKPQSHIRSLPLIAIGALASSYVRPEFFLSYAIFVFAYLFLIAVNRKGFQFRNEIVPVSMLVGVSFLLMIVFGIPVWDKQGGRSFEAFSQHFSINWVYWSGSQLDPWVDYQDIMVANFGDAHSIYSVLYNNFPIFIRHILYNIVNYVGSFFQSLFVHFNMILPSSNKVFTWIESASFAVVIIVCGFLKRRSIFSECIENSYAYRFLLFSCAVFCIPPIISSIIIYPEGHYLIIQVVLVSIAIAILASSGSRMGNPSLINILIMLAFVFVATPYISENWYFSEQGLSKDRELNNLHTIEYIRSLNIQQNVNMLEADGGYYIYVGDNFHRIAQSSKDIDFATFLKRKNIDMIVVSDGMRTDRRFREDKTWASFLRDCRAFGYVSTDIRGTNRTLITREAILAAAEH